MRELAGRVAALDPEAGAALRVIAYFDELAGHPAGLGSVVRGAAFLAGCPARLVDDARHLRIRIGPDGVPLDAREPVLACWPAQDLTPGGGARLLLERERTASVLDAVILERAAGVARTVLERTRGRAAPADPAWVEVLIDGHAAEHERRAAAARLGLTGPARAIAVHGETARVQPMPPGGGPADPGVPAGRRAGIGVTVPVLDLPASWESARTALRFTAAGGEHDPGPRLVHAGDLGTLTALAAAIHPGTPPPADVDALRRAAVAAPWMLATLDAVVTAPSLRAAAGVLHVHHSTLQARLGQASGLLGWDVTEPPGRLRLHLALIARRLHRNELT
ncbi:helix-turn-helix domain-containing protein [Nonomuraea bangladeshensis]|uniref:helix-turn-helix domain-containing protein n=1 Tax=Nonomuraea bangladeshensis TaxID=404385 RepID=UPI003C2FF4DC